jgi:hypothetical protein
MPVVAILEPDACQIGTDSPCREELWQVEGILAGFGDRAPAEVFAGHRAHVLAVAVPAAFPDVDAAT